MFQIYFYSEFISHQKKDKSYFKQKIESLLIINWNLCLGDGGFLGKKFVLLHWTHEALLLLGSLEATVTKLGRGIDKLQCNLFEGHSLDLLDQRLAQCDWTLGGAHYAALEHEKVLFDDTIMWETTLNTKTLVRNFFTA